MSHAESSKDGDRTPGVPVLTPIVCDPVDCDVLLGGRIRWRGDSNLIGWRRARSGVLELGQYRDDDAHFETPGVQHDRTRDQRLLESEVLCSPAFRLANHRVRSQCDGCDGTKSPPL